MPFVTENVSNLKNVKNNLSKHYSFDEIKISNLNDCKFENKKDNIEPIWVLRFISFFFLNYFL